jgi:homoserine kinase type II
MRIVSLPQVLSIYPPHVQPTSFPEALGGSGGLSGATLWRYDSLAGGMLVKAWPVDGPPISHLEAVHKWLGEAKDLSFLPQPVPALDGRTVHQFGGRCWEVAPWMRGTPDLQNPPSTEHVRTAFRALATFHQRLSREALVGPSPGLEHCIGELIELVSHGFDRLQSVLDQAGENECYSTAKRCLVLARAMTPELLSMIRDGARHGVALQPCLRDARPEHFLFNEDRLSGLVDFGAMGIESVAADLARLSGEWFPGDDHLLSQALASYAEVRPLNPSEGALLRSFEAAADLMIAGNWLRWNFLAHRRFEDPSALARGISRGLSRLERRATSMKSQMFV